MQDKVYKLKECYFRLHEIWQMGELKITDDSEYYPNTKLSGVINGIEYSDYICVRHYKYEYQEQVIAQNDFYREYKELYEAFLKYNKDLLVKCGKPKETLKKDKFALQILKRELEERHDYIWEYSDGSNIKVRDMSASQLESAIRETEEFLKKKRKVV